MKKFVSKIKEKRPAEDTSTSPMQIGSPHDLILQIPRQQLDANGVPIQVIDYEIDRATMGVALTHMAGYVSEKGEDITVIAIGGAVNLLFLQSRETTHDIDFFGTNLNNNQRVVLDEAAAFANTQSGGSLGAEWFNNQTQMWLSPNIHRQLTQDALEQGDVIFKEQSLTVLAAPWQYAFTAKADRISRGRRGVHGARARPYDAADAASYLRLYIQKGGGRPQTFNTAQRWCQEYGFNVEISVLRDINAEYEVQYKVSGLV